MGCLVSSDRVILRGGTSHPERAFFLYALLHPSPYTVRAVNQRPVLHSTHPRFALARSVHSHVRATRHVQLYGSVARCLCIHAREDRRSRRSSDVRSDRLGRPPLLLVLFVLLDHLDAVDLFHHYALGLRGWRLLHLHHRALGPRGWRLLRLHHRVFGDLLDLLALLALLDFDAIIRVGVQVRGGWRL